MRGKALHWIVDEENSYKKLMHADFLQGRYVIAFVDGQFWLYVLFEGKDGLKSGPYKNPWAAMAKAEKDLITAINAGAQVP